MNFMNNNINEYASFAMNIGMTDEIKAMRTPAILEQSPQHGNLMSVFDRLVQDRIIYVTGAVTQDMSDIISAQIMYLDSLYDESLSDDENAITLMVDSPGGSVRAGLSIIDAINLAKSPIYTTCYGMAASMGSVILSAGKKGNRKITKYSEVMLHQSSGGASGNIQDAKIGLKHWDKYNENLFDILAENCDKEFEQMLEDTERDFWLNSVAALKYGIVDEIIWDLNTTITLENLDTIKSSMIYKHSNE